MLYNADSGLANAALDTLHKLFSPSTYACKLCDITFGLTAMKREWAATIAALPHPVAFLHRDEWHTQFPGNPMPLPAILLETGTDLKPLISAADFAGITSLHTLQALLSCRLAKSATPGPDQPFASTTSQR